MANALAETTTKAKYHIDYPQENLPESESLSSSNPAALSLPAQDIEHHGDNEHDNTQTHPDNAERLGKLHLFPGGAGTLAAGEAVQFRIRFTQSEAA